MQMIEQRFSLFCVFTQESAFFSNVRPFFRVSRIVHGYFMGGPRGKERGTFFFGGGPAIGDDLSCAKLEGRDGGSKREIFWGLHTKQNLPPSPCRGCDQPDIEGGDEKCAHHGRSDDIRSLRGETVYYHCTMYKTEECTDGPKRDLRSLPRPDGMESSRKVSHIRKGERNLKVCPRRGSETQTVGIACTPKNIPPLLSSFYDRDPQKGSPAEEEGRG